MLLENRHASTPDYRVRVCYDDDGQQNQDSPYGTPLPESAEQYADNPVMRLMNPSDDPATGPRRPVTYAEYCAYEGNPDRHVILAFEIEKRCPCCNVWSYAQVSLGFFDCMDDDPWLAAIDYSPPGGTYTPDQVKDWPSYARSTAEELLEEARERQTLRAVDHD